MNSATAPHPDSPAAGALPAPTPAPTLHRTLDPSDWATHRRLGHRMIDDMVDFWAGARSRPTWQKPGDDVRASLRAPLATGGQSPESVYEEFRRNILPYPTGNIHPRFWSHVIGTGTAMGAFGDFLAASMNCNVFGGEQVGSLVENQVLGWLGEMLGFPATASGLLLSGGSMANLLGLCVALRCHAGPALRTEGLCSQPRRFRFYASTETHNCLDKTAELLGLGRSALRHVAVDQDFRLSLPALEQAIAEDRAAGWVPFCVVGNAITVGTGAIDPLAEIAAVCGREGLWFHVDGAIGALARITPELRPALDAVRLADSVAFDLHKWLHIPYESGCLMVREGHRHREAFANTTAYLAALEGGLSSGDRWPNQLGPELSRGFKALKVWLSLKEQGRQAFAEAMSANLAQAAHLVALLGRHADLELMATAPANIVNFRFHPAALTAESELEALNRRILIQLHESGHSVPSHNRLQGRFSLRVAITNHRTRPEDLESLVEEVRRLGQRPSAVPIR